MLRDGFGKGLSCVVVSARLNVGRLRTGVSSFEPGWAGLHRRAVVFFLSHVLGSTPRALIHCVIKGN